jgi:acyl-coenzyme A synthetase/AMP-(fatty) acid ligase
MAIAGRPAANTFECVEAVALRYPERTALVQDRMTWTFQAFYRDLVRIVRTLGALGVRRGQRVAVGTQGFQAGLLLLIAAENLGAVTTSFLPSGDRDVDVLFGMVDWVISDAPQDCPPTTRFVHLDAEFLQRVAAVDPDDGNACPRVALETHEPQRISRTSGSSGQSKFMLLARQAQEHWVRAGAENGRYRPESRLLVAGPLVMNAVFTRSSACLRMGAAVLDLSRTGLVGHEITHVLALPVLLEEILASLPAGFVLPNPVDVGTVGGFVSAELRQRAARVFGGAVLSRYGANEVTGICEDLDATGTGVISAGVDLRIVDGEDRDVPMGEMGIVAVRTPGMVEGYIGDEASTRASFRGGWFYSGDWGTLVAPRVLQLAGRHDDLINISGIKVPAAQLEASVRALVAGSDCAVLAVNLQGGAVTVGIAVVGDPAAGRDALLKRIEAEVLAKTSARAQLVFVDALPVMGNGKLDRVALHRLIAAAPPVKLS